MSCDLLSAGVSGGVAQRWRRAGRPAWTLDQTVQMAIQVDAQLCRGIGDWGTKPPQKTKFHQASLRGDYIYMRKWVRACHFCWLK